MKNWKQTNGQIAAIIKASNGNLKIVSGEGENGTTEDYKGAQTVRAIKARLTKERCGDDRWARIDTYEDHALSGVI